MTHKLFRTLLIPVACLLAAPLGATAWGAEKELPLLVSDDFEQGAERWLPTDADAWKVSADERGKVFEQHKKKSNYEPPHRSPYNRALLKDVLVGDFQIDVEVKSTHPDYAHRDVCLFFGYQDPANFYYVHLGKKADPHANQIFIVDDSPRLKISMTTTPGTDWDDKWHHVRVVRTVSDGAIAIYFDDLTKPVMTATDKTFTWGQVGLGSFDDTSAWDDFQLRGVKVEKQR
ncbi:MAG: hypothetical protein KDA41_15825 [Planctomycetales bacterium]|nr:hypothetical protein [Planctomycetales bacterium]